MRHWGKIFGVIIGLMGGIWGALFGFLIGNIIDNINYKKYRASYRNSSADQQERQALFFRATFQIMGHLSKAKGRVTQIDIQVANQFMDRMQLQGEARRAAQHAFGEGKQSQFPLRKTLQELRQICKGQLDLLKIFLEIQFQAAFSDGSLHPNEKEVLYIIAEELGMSRHQFKLLIVMLESGYQFGKQQNWHGNYNTTQPNTQMPTLADACKVLGVKESDDSVIIKRAYRKQMNEHHPDKLVARGLPAEMIDMAKEKAQEIQAAYDLIKREKKFK